MDGITVFDVANYILNKQGSMSAMKLQKLVYYSQAWSLVWDDEERKKITSKCYKPSMGQSRHH